jgi:hypothetical protein
LKEQFNLRMQRATQQLTNTSKLRAGAAEHRPRADAHAPEGGRRPVMTEPAKNQGTEAATGPAAGPATAQFE